MTTTRARKRITKHDLKTDAFTTTVFAAKEWAEKNMRSVVLVIGGVVVVVVAVWGFTGYRSSRTQAAQALHGEAGVEIRSGNAPVAIALLQRLLDKYPGSKLAGPGCLQLAQLQFQERSFDEARLAFQRYVDDFADSPFLTAAAWAGLGAIEEQAGFPENAVTHYRQAVDADPEGSSAPENLRRLIRSAVMAGDTSAAMEAFETLDVGFPDDADNRIRAQQMLIERGFMPPH